MKQLSKWIWFPGDFEIYHSLKLNTRREERSYQWPAFWKLDDCYHNVKFRKKVVCEQSEKMIVFANGIGYISVDGNKHAFEESILLNAGVHMIDVAVACPNGLPCIFVEGNQAVSNSSWEANECSPQWVPAGCNEMYLKREDSPEVFRFEYEEIAPVSESQCQGGILYDFGKQTFAGLTFKQVTAEEDIPIFYGESKEEALDTQNSYLRDVVPNGCKEYTCKPRAFRYLFVFNSNTNSYKLSAQFEYLPLEQKGSFQCSDQMINQIWDTAAYTFHLNSREFFLDGIKRDRWTWSGDAYQSYLINNYLFFDEDICKRTIIALRGKDPIFHHINTILDYSFYWVMSVYLYYQSTKDIDFVHFIYPRMKSMMDFCISRADEKGFVQGMENDWVFIDWADIDKTGAVCAEQMLFAESLHTMQLCGQLIGKNEDTYQIMYYELKDKINNYFWNEEKGAFIDSFESGKNNVTRHANIFALLLGFADKKQRENIIKNVILNDKIPQISTPYFKFYELEAMCDIGNFDYVTNQIRNYWGGMLKLGATTFWEEYDPSVKGADHYQMYGDKYGKSLCHAWGASPIYLLGKYYLGVHPTAAGYETFDVIPQLGGLEWIEGTVPVNGGKVYIKMTKNYLEVTSSLNGGEVHFGKKKYNLEKDITFTLNY